MLVSTDTDLTRSAAAGDREAFERVYAESLPVVWAFASRHAAGRVAAELLAGRILRRAFAELAGYDGQVPFAAWLLAIARRVVRVDGPRPVRPPLAPHRSHRA